MTSDLGNWPPARFGETKTNQQDTLSVIKGGLRSITICVKYASADMMNAHDSLSLALANAEDVVSRLDERLDLHVGRGGLVSRLDYEEASAWAWNSGLSASTEDLLLHHESMDVRTPTQDLRSAYGLLLARRKAMFSTGDLLSPDGAHWLAGLRKSPPADRPDEARAPSPPQDHDGLDLVADVVAQVCAIEKRSTEDAEAALAEWFAILLSPGTRRPALLQAALALEAWALIKPYPRAPYVGPVLVAAWLRHVKRIPSHLITIERGLRAYRRLRHAHPGLPSSERVANWLNIIAEAAAVTRAEFQRLELQRFRLSRLAKGRRSHSHMDEAIKLVIETPLVTIPMMAKALKITQTSSARILGVLGPSLTEITGRSRFRAWRA